MDIAALRGQLPAVDYHGKIVDELCSSEWRRKD